MNKPPTIALALSGGGSRAIAFHLGCLRALNDRGLLSRISVLSAVSGGSVIAGLYAYCNEPFESFDERVVALLRRGLHRDIVKRLLRPALAARVLATNLIARPAAFVSRILRLQPPLRRWASRSDALEQVLRSQYGELELAAVARPNLDVVFNACELRTGTAFRFGNRRSGSWRTGEIAGNHITVAHAVACSAAYPMFLPAFDRCYDFEKKGVREQKRVIITDGGVFDNLGTTCIEPGRDSAYSLHTYEPDYLICCSAGYGQFAGEQVPYSLLSRTTAAFEAVFRKAQDATMNRLHMLRSSGQLRGFILPYLGQQDNALPARSPDLVTRDEVFGYPTNFAAMPEDDLRRLALRGEQLTRLLLGYYTPEL